MSTSPLHRSGRIATRCTRRFAHSFAHRSVRRLARMLPILVTAFAVASCEGSPLGNTGDALLDDEVRDLFSALLELSLVGADSVEDGVIRRTVDRTGDCSSGFYGVQGLVEGEGDAAAGEQRIAGDVDVDFFRCRLRIGDGEMVLDGDRRVRGTYTVDRVGTERAYTLDLAGGLSFVADDERTGRCAVDLRVTFDLDSGVQNLVIEGSMCRRSGSFFTSL